VNTARFVFLDPRARDFYLDWDRAARDVVAVLRSAADPGLTIFTYTAEPGTRDAEALALLGSWAATAEQIPS
jgi:hypothetical protein